MSYTSTTQFCLFTGVCCTNCHLPLCHSECTPVRFHCFKVSCTKAALLHLVYYHLDTTFDCCDWLQQQKLPYTEHLVIWMLEKPTQHTSAPYVGAKLVGLTLNFSWESQAQSHDAAPNIFKGNSCQMKIFTSADTHTSRCSAEEKNCTSVYILISISLYSSYFSMYPSLTNHSDW